MLKQLKWMRIFNECCLTQLDQPYTNKPFKGGGLYYNVWLLFPVFFHNLLDLKKIGPLSFSFQYVGTTTRLSTRRGDLQKLSSMMGVSALLYMLHLLDIFLSQKHCLGIPICNSNLCIKLPNQSSLQNTCIHTLHDVHFLAVGGHVDTVVIGHRLACLSPDH